MGYVVKTTEKRYPYVDTKSDICGGSPAIEGARISVWSIIKWYKIGMSIEEIMREFPELTPSQLHDAFSYYYDHQKQIEDEIAENEDEDKWKELLEKAVKKKLNAETFYLRS